MKCVLASGIVTISTFFNVAFFTQSEEDLSLNLKLSMGRQELKISAKNRNFLM